MPFIADLLQALPSPSPVPPPTSLSVSGPVPAAAGTVRYAVVFDSFFEQPRSRETVRGERRRRGCRNRCIEARANTGEAEAMLGSIQHLKDTHCRCW